nr:hypothetical protein [Candidatus Sigynarchaeota archaeon]
MMASKNVNLVDFSADAKHLELLLQRVEKSLSRWVDAAKAKGIVFGLDGFLDEIYTVILKRYSLKEYDIVHSMAEWAKILEHAAGSAANFEIMVKKRSTGGFVANTAGALLAIGSALQKVTLIGNFGNAGILPPFNDAFLQKYGCKLVSIGDPGLTNAYEFDDGKLMLTNFTPILSMDVKTLLDKISEDNLVDLLNNASLFGLGYWSINPSMTDIFRFFSTRVFAKLRKPLHLFMDLASLRKRSEQDICLAVDVINSFPKNIFVTLSLNDKEAVQLYEAVSKRKIAEAFPGMDTAGENKALFTFLLGQLHTWLSCQLVIHTPKNAFSLTPDASSKGAPPSISIVPNAFTKQASFTVAAGDAFNGGVCMGLLGGCAPEEMLLLGNVITSYFIRSGIRCNHVKAIEFLRHYKHYLDADYPEILQS